MIRFPRVSIATSVVNRILNLRDELHAQETASASPSPPSAPNVPDTSETGPALESALYAPTAPVDADPIVAEDIALKSLL